MADSAVAKRKRTCTVALRGARTCKARELGDKKFKDILSAHTLAKEEIMTQSGDNSSQGTSVADVKDQAVEQAHELKDTSVEHVSAVAQEAKEKAINVGHDVRRELENQGNTQARRLATTLRDRGPGRVTWPGPCRSDPTARALSYEAHTSNDTTDPKSAGSAAHASARVSSASRR